MLNHSFNTLTNDQLNLYPKTLQKEIDYINNFIFKNINNGVYHCGFATSQSAYEQLFNAHDKLDKRLRSHRYLLGKHITEADWRLFTTLIRFDSVYYAHFKCNMRRIEDYPQLANYLRELYQWPGIS
jgi:glutathionyl-hydroquinone reductase